MFEIFCKIFKLYWYIYCGIDLIIIFVVYKK